MRSVCSGARDYLSSRARIQHALIHLPRSVTADNLVRYAIF